MPSQWSPLHRTDIIALERVQRFTGMMTEREHIINECRLDKMGATVRIGLQPGKELQSGKK